MSIIPPSAPGAAQKDFKPRLGWATIIVAFAFLVLLGRLYQLQILQGDEYKEKADENFVKEIRQPADRGQILDRNRRILVDSRPSYDVTLTPYFCGKQCDDVLSRLATMLSLSQEEIDRARMQLAGAKKLERFRPFTVKIDITRDELDLYLAHSMDLVGVDVVATPHRSYRYAGLGGHLIGYMNEAGPDELKRLNEDVLNTGTGQGPYLLGDYTGRRGLERKFERVLGRPRIKKPLANANLRAHASHIFRSAFSGRFEQYRGLWFLNFDRNAVSLVDYLGKACDYIDVIVDQAEQGMHIIGSRVNVGQMTHLRLCQDSLCQRVLRAAFYRSGNCQHIIASRTALNFRRAIGGTRFGHDRTPAIGVINEIVARRT